MNIHALCHALRNLLFVATRRRSHKLYSRVIVDLARLGLLAILVEIQAKVGEGADDKDEEHQQCIQDIEVLLIAGQSAFCALTELHQSAIRSRKEVRQDFTNNQDFDVAEDDRAL